MYRREPNVRSIKMEKEKCPSPAWLNMDVHN